VQFQKCIEETRRRKHQQRRRREHVDGLEAPVDGGQAPVLQALDDPDDAGRLGQGQKNYLNAAGSDW